jgi:hypothetical protein
MANDANAVTDPQARASATASILRWLAIGVAAVAAIVFLIRLPAALRDFDRRATFNSHQTTLGRSIQGADGVDISNDFLEQALGLLPSNATYVVEQAQTPEIAKTYGIVPTTLQALRDYVRFVLLPRREAPGDQAEYLLCYACNTDPYDPRLRRLWSDPHGLVIGRLDG